MSGIDEKYMNRCLSLARKGRGQVAPNPMVGSVIVCDGKIIGEGYHRQYGGAHAEVHAIASVKDESLLKRSTLYVNLEPCSHHGKTPPCAELIIRKGIPRVIIGCTDPFPEVAGRGACMLREAGVEVVTGCLEAEAIDLNRYFMTAHTQKRPYIILKWAQSADGFIDSFRDSADVKPIVFSTPLSGQEVHKLRSEVQGILVGTRTAILDNPSLTVRSWSGKSPLRIVPDKMGVLPESLRLLDGSEQTVVFTTVERSNHPGVRYEQVNSGDFTLPELLRRLYELHIHSLLVEGGRQLLNSFIEEGLWEEARVETSPLILKDGVEAPCLNSNVRRMNSGVFYYRNLNSNNSVYCH